MSSMSSRVTSATVSNAPSAAHTSRPRRRSAETREHLLDVAARLFYWEGIHATGVDRVAADAEVAPTTLYRLFGSKDGLVAAYIERAGGEYRALITRTTEPGKGPPRERILGLFDVFAEIVAPENCRGCPFLMALAEFPDPESTIHVAAVSHKEWVRDRFRELAEELATETTIADPALLGDQLALLVDGIYGSIQSLGADGPAASAGAIAATLIDASAPIESPRRDRAPIRRTGARPRR
jgi:AcrR family transcriptional regulator